ncbi:GNAT family N-acetyltransferase [Haliangium ochraceum]|uniref:Transcriptional regulator, MarR family with acetyltransferase activity n=1 Tax=Haliangium ochraceum (strain DSM 14365 / JCM 11303 / SMP-2) TaxID=502025 RepID=D0LTD4_HALO1|nr:GNAT family N-acetyltransferase [Haliangium ochraceum]ACY13829.1 transcriptional regulator, MarR family with acetyltransferase activity [Haliangium ochraceum DSM 14365]
MDTDADFLGSLGALALTLRMRRLADRLSEQGRRVYDELDIALEPGWYACLLLLRERGTLSVSDAARLLGVRHPSLVKTSKALEAAGLVASVADPGDARRRLLALTPEAERRFPAFQRVWEAFADALSELSEASGGALGEQLGRVEALLDERGLDERVRAHLQPPPTRSRRRRRAAAPEIRAARASDRKAVLAIARELVRSGDTYAYDPAIADGELWNYWRPSARGRGFVASVRDEIVGMFVIRPNHPGPGSHVANASYAVRADKRGLGLGRAMGEASLLRAKALGYASMQFNIVVSSNRAAVALWRSLGFCIIGTVPGGFRLPDGRRVPHHIMFRDLE